MNFELGTSYKLAPVGAS